MKRQSSLRVRLLLLVLVAIVPLFSLSVFWALQDEARDLQTARSRLQAAAASEAARQDREAESARLLLVAVANASDIRAGSASGCQTYLESLGGSFPAFNAGVLDLDGRLRCSIRSRKTPAADPAQVPYFQEAVRTRGFAVGAYMAGVLTGRPVLGFGYPVMEAGTMTGVAFAAVRLEDMQRRLSEAALPEGGTITVLDRHAQVLASTSPEFKQGAVVPADRLRDLSRASTPGVDEAPDPADGVARIHAFAPARGAAAGAIFVVAGVTREAIVAQARTRLHAALAGLCLATLLGAFLAWLYAGRQIVRQTRQILDATSRLTRGEFGARVPGASGAGTEFARIADGLNQMAQSLEERDQALHDALAASAQARTTQDLVLNTMLEGVIAVDSNRNFLIFNKAAASVFEQPDTPGPHDSRQTRLAGIFKPGTDTLYPTEELALSRALQGESGSDFDMFVRNRLIPEGRLLRSNYRPIIGPDGIVGAMGVFTDITAAHRLELERKAVEEESRGNAERLARLVEVQTELAEANLGTGELMDRMAALAQRVTGAPGAEFELIAGDDFVLRSSAGAAGRHAGMRRKRGQLSRDAIQQARVVRCDDIELDARVDHEWCRMHGVRSLMGGAIRLDGVPFGGLVLLSDQPNGFSPADANVLELLCEFLGALFQRMNSASAMQNIEQRYAALFDAAPVPMWVFDPQDLRFLAVNDAAIDAYGFAREEFLSMTLLDIRPEPERQAVLQVLADGTYGRARTWKHWRRDGTVFSVQTFTSAVRYGERDARFALAIDVTERVEAENAVAEQMLTLRRAANAVGPIVARRTLRDTLQEVAEQLRGVIGAHHSLVTAVANGDWDGATSVVSPSDESRRYRDPAQHPGSGIHSVVCETNRPLRLSRAELQAHPQWKGMGDPAERQTPMNGWLAVPLIGRDGRNMGVIQLIGKHEGDFTLQDEYVALQMAQLVSVAIENARLFDELQEFNNDLERKVIERSRQVANQEAVFRAVADQAPQVMWIVNPKGAVTYLNRYWYRLVGGAPPQWLGHQWMDVVDPEDVQEMRDKWKVCLADNSVFAGFRRVRAQDGTIHTLAYRASPVLDDMGAIICWVGLDADITESRKVEQALRVANQELEAFSSSVSHDLRSPLNTINGFSRLLEVDLKANAGQKADHYLSRIRVAATHMGDLIEGLLALAQVSRQNLHLTMVDLSRVSEDIADSLQRDDPGRKVSWQIQPGMVAHGDSRLIRSLLQNLIGNAWKFSARLPEAEISVGCVTARAKAPVYFVRDNGAGFDMQYAYKLFGTFQRLHAESEFPGTGIGLATVKRAVARHGGTVWADSKPDKGSTFYFTLNALEALDGPSAAAFP
ncbi:MAG: PAS domain S-box protein [Comamonadaceae bacterium]|nr:MAG: PAS domain S-box protein [Comamonadaceae bacterium]